MIRQEIHPDFTEFQTDIADIAQEFSRSGETIHKARNELKIMPLHGIETVVKAFKIPHMLNRIVYAYFRDSKAKKSYENALKLERLHVNTPKPIAYIEFIRFGLFERSYYISRYEPYDFTIREVFHHKVADTETILRQFAAFSYDLHVKGVWHVDFSLGNILIRKEETGYRFFLVDINRMEFRDIAPKEGLKNFNKFWAKDREDLRIIAREYAKLSGLDADEATAIALEAADKLEARVNIKKRLKSKR